MTMMWIGMFLGKPSNKQTVTFRNNAEIANNQPNTLPLKNSVISDYIILYVYKGRKWVLEAYSDPLPFKHNLKLLQFLFF